MQDDSFSKASENGKHMQDDSIQDDSSLNANIEVELNPLADEVILSMLSHLPFFFFQLDIFKTYQNLLGTKTLAWSIPECFDLSTEDT